MSTTLTVPAVPVDPELAKKVKNASARHEQWQAERDRVLFVLTPEARARFEAAEREAERRFLFGDGGPS